ncbi:hypothetical protein NQ315_009867 [Exocentrus adspersus]|uniref:DUF4776 domain-containing protein n=1 Tax=Exocentrus adspersus TaxID=1586481 RepID=A0AAV8WHG3_9CUCU|nr:hypothetical protein NQ315_009867 [Exocentrus adspersus]
MASTLFLLEFHFAKIHFEPNVSPVPSRKDILINIKFEDVNLNVDPEELPDVTRIESDTGSTVTYDMGKSYLFMYNPKDLIKQFKKEKLEVSVRVNHKTVGRVSFPWKEDFAGMVELFQRIGVVKAVDFWNPIQPKDLDGNVVAEVEMFTRLSCFGDSLETQFQIKPVGDTKEYIFKNPYDTHTFKCQVLDKNQDVLPVVNLYNPATRVQNHPTETQTLSWTEIFTTDPAHAPSRSASCSPFSEGPTTDGPGLMIPLTEILNRDSIETVSICFRPEENKFFDLLNVITTEVSATPDKTTVTFSKDKSKKHEKGRLVRSCSEDFEDPLELTADKINRRLCKNRDCPAAKKFKEYGIGPLATGRGIIEQPRGVESFPLIDTISKKRLKTVDFFLGLGTLYGDVEPPAEYGLSHTYGTMSNYGPFGVYTRPKSPDQPFVPSKNALETTPEPPRCKKCSSLGLRGGAPWPNQSFVILEDAPLRLRGGGIGEAPSTYKGLPWKELLRLKGGAGVVELDPSLGLKSPIKECKDVMDKFEEILVAYRKALGPCGQATCPNAPSLAQEKCKSVCGKGEGMPSLGSAAVQGGVLCETPCDFNGGYTAAACRQPTCAYAKYKLDLMDDDAALELQFLPPAVSGKCGHPKCPYPVQPDLPPIHWDCPDPLPKGNCKNLNCPFQPAKLRKLKCPEPKPGPCGSPDCPYALPPPCGLPTCPFKPTPCPFLEQETGKDQDDTCDNPDCPFANPDLSPSESFEDPKMKGQFTGCANPRCPFATRKKQRPQPKSGKVNVCANPSCPFAKVKKQDVCDNPACPFAVKKAKTQFKSCGDPLCPFGEKPVTKKDSVCYNPECPFAATKPKNKSCGDPRCPFDDKAKNKDDLCENPDCPFAGRKGSGDSSGKRMSKDKSELCDNPDCPFMGTDGSSSKRKSTDKSETCDNPDCPFNEENCSKDSANCSGSASVCENPDCPFTEQKKEPVCDDPMCPYSQPLPSCGIPGCPFEPVPFIPCPVKPGSVSKKPRVSGQQQAQEAFVMIETEVVEEVSGGNEAAVAEDGRKPPDETKKTKKKRKKRSQFVYSIGNQYPGVKVGHKECVTPMFKVPPKMGWLWNIPMTMTANIKPRRGWKPGAIQRKIAAMIRAHREAKGLGMLRLPKFKRNKDGDLEENDVDVQVSPKPTLQIQKKDGAYWITMNPLKDPKTLAENENPYMECTPMQFKITKNKRKKEDEGGEGDSKLCYCEGEDSSSSDSELDIEFTPPAGIIHPERFKRKKNIVHCEVQYDTKDFTPESPKGKGKDKKGKKDKGGKKGKKKK